MAMLSASLCVCGYVQLAEIEKKSVRAIAFSLETGKTAINSHRNYHKNSLLK